MEWGNDAGCWQRTTSRSTWFSPLIVQRGIAQFRSAIAEPNLACKGDIDEQRAEKDKPTQAENKLGIFASVVSNGALTPFVPSDFAQALTTDIVINPITLNADDHMLITRARSGAAALSTVSARPSASRPQTARCRRVPALCDR